METLFENTHIRNRELAKEMYGYFYFRRPLLIVCYIIIILSFIGNVLLAVFGEAYNWGVLIFIPLFCLLRLYNYLRQVNLMVKRDYEIHGKEITFTAVATDENIQLTVSTGAVSKLEYSNIKKGAQTKNLILLLSKANLIYIFPKDGFTKGSKEAFVEFLRNKGVKI